jgi:hypothetical protein
MVYKVTLPYDASWSALNWAKKHCPSYITNEASKEKNQHQSFSRRMYYIDYLFSDERDAMIFSLRWL